MRVRRAREPNPVRHALRPRVRQRDPAVGDDAGVVVVGLSPPRVGDPSLRDEQHVGHPERSGQVAVLGGGQLLALAAEPDVADHAGEPGGAQRGTGRSAAE